MKKRKTKAKKQNILPELKELIDQAKELKMYMV